MYKIYVHEFTSSIDTRNLQVIHNNVFNFPSVFPLIAIWYARFEPPHAVNPSFHPEFMLRLDHWLN